MKIREIRALDLRGAIPADGWRDELKPDDVVHTLILVVSDDGLCGIGVTTADLVRAALKTLEPLYAGECALEPERVPEKLHQASFWLGRGGTLTHTISGIDIALWDLLGKAKGQSAGRLLGGRWREKVLPYASLLLDTPEKLTESLCLAAAASFRAFRIGWVPFGRVSDSLDEKIVSAARDSVGFDVPLMVDAGGSDTALRTAGMLHEYDVAWFEEPLRPDQLGHYVALRRTAGVPIAGGEVLTPRQSFTPYLQAGVFDIVQPDVTEVGGLSEARRIGWIASEHGVWLIPHGWNTSVGLAADLQLASALSDTGMVEYVAGSSYIDAVIAEPWQLDGEGMLAIPDGPGLGLHLNLDELARYSESEHFATWCADVAL